MVLGNRLAFMGRPQCQAPPPPALWPLARTEASGAPSSPPSQPFERNRRPLRTCRGSVPPHVGRRAGPSPSVRGDLVEAPLVHGQVEGPPLSLPQPPLDESRPRIGMEVHHVMEPHPLEPSSTSAVVRSMAHVRVTPGSPSTASTKARLVRKCTSTGPSSIQCRARTTGEVRMTSPMLENRMTSTRVVVHLVRLGHGRKVTP